VLPWAPRASARRGAPRPRRLRATAAALVACLAAGRAEARYTAEVDGTALQAFGDRASDTLVLRVSADLLRLEGDVGDDGIPEFGFDLASFSTIFVSAGAGNDVVVMDESVALFTTTKPTTVDGGPGRDELIGGQGAEVFVAGEGDDRVEGRGGADVALLGAHDDVFVWRPGHGSDVVEGQDGDDRLAFDGSAAAETYDVAANGARVLLFRDVGAVLMDFDDVEALELASLGGSDTVVVNDLTGTDLLALHVDLASSPGGEAGDAQPDAVIADGTTGPDTVDVGAADGALVLTGLAAEIRVEGADAGLDRLEFVGVGNDRVHVNGTKADDLVSIAPSPVPGALRTELGGFPAPFDVSGAAVLGVRGLGGADAIGCTGNVAALGIPLELYGGKGDDTLAGSNGADLLVGEGGRDVVQGTQGSDVAFLGPGKDTFVWNPGDGSDVVEGERGADTLLFHGSAAAEQIAVSPNGQRLLLTRDVGAVTMDADGVEQVAYQAVGGADTVTVNDMAGTAVKSVTVDLESPPDSGLGDAQPDAVVVNGTPLPDAIRIRADAAGVLAARRRGAVRIEHAEPALDTLTVNGLGGADAIAVAPTAGAAIGLTVNPD